eukprot:m.209801 g.209801  ORF g.209801 m.209801 type:complete len:391 (+) comp33050_c2_seq10:142-1314(+)
MATSRDAASIVAGGEIGLAEDPRRSELQKILEEKKNSKVAADTQNTDRAKLRGLNRELYNLVGERTPLAEASGYSQRKAELVKRAAVSKWTCAKFHNGARKDQLMLSHWVKESEIQTEYAFSKFDKPSRVPIYSRDEYLRFLSDDDWTEDETQLLFELCRQFDLRFVVVHDRFVGSSLSPKKERSVENLKNRYYDVWTNIAKSRGKQPHSVDVTYRYDVEHEERRKKQLVGLSKRTYAQMHEEDLLISELKKIKQHNRECDNAIKVVTKTIIEDVSRKRKSSIESNKRSDKDRSATTTIKQNITNRPPPPITTYLRSTLVHRQLAVRPPKLSQIVAMKCEERGIPEFPMPTHAVDMAYENLRKTLLEHVQLQVALDQKRTEITQVGSSKK